VGNAHLDLDAALLAGIVFAFADKADAGATMRPLLPLSALALLLTTGCAAFVAHSGSDPHALTTREQVHQAYGEPDDKGGGADEQFEVYHRHSKVAENGRGAVLLLFDTYILGLMELYFFPTEVGRVGWKTIAGWTVRFTYDASGRVKTCKVEDLNAIEWPFEHIYDTPATPPAESGKGK
jgi:hypothetical protein